MRAALRDAYGASSLRLTWSTDQEARARQVDDALVVEERADTVEVASREVATIDRTLVIGDPLPNIDEAPAATETASDIKAPRGWKVGDDPLASTAKGTTPTAGTIRSRVWKNHGAGGAWDDENRARLSAGRPPQRTNPITGARERAVVDIETGRASWPGEPVDPFDPAR